MGYTRKRRSRRIRGGRKRRTKRRTQLRRKRRTRVGGRNGGKRRTRQRRGGEGEYGMRYSKDNRFSGACGTVSDSEIKARRQGCKFFAYEADGKIYRCKAGENYKDPASGQIRKTCTDMRRGYGGLTAATRGEDITSIVAEEDRPRLQPPVTYNEFGTPSRQI